MAYIYYIYQIIFLIKWDNSIFLSGIIFLDSRWLLYFSINSSELSLDLTKSKAGFLDSFVLAQKPDEQ